MLMAFAASAQWEDQSHAFDRWPVRNLGGRQFSLARLYPWWTNAAALNRIQADSYQRSLYKQKHGMDPTNAIASKPLAGWCRVIGTNFHSHYLGWLVEGEIEEMPGKRHPARFILEHPPESDKEMFEADRREWKALVQGGHIVIATEHYQDIQGNGWWNASGVPITGSQGAFFSGLNAASVQRAQQVHDELAKMPLGDAYRLDFFAIKLGCLQDASHLEVWDLGVAPDRDGN